MKGFELSTDYERLYALINNGYRVPAWILYSDKFQEPIYDLVEVKISKYDSNRHTIGSRGVGYENGENTLEGFIENCKLIDLKFVMPTI